MNKIMDFLFQFDECKPKKRGRSLNTANIDQNKQEKQGNICSQVAYKGTDKEKTNYYRTDQGRKGIAKSKKDRLKKRLAARKAKKENLEIRRKEKEERLLKKAEGLGENVKKDIKERRIKTFKKINELRRKWKKENIFSKEEKKKQESKKSRMLEMAKGIDKETDKYSNASIFFS